MVFTSIKINDFRGIKSCEIEDLSRVNLFIGKNNSGKSSILEAVFLLVGGVYPQSSININLGRELVHTNNNDFRFLFYRLDYNSKIEICGTTARDSYRKLQIVPTESNNFEMTTTTTTASTAAVNGPGNKLNGSVTGLKFTLNNKEYHTSSKTYTSTIFGKTDSNGNYLLSNNFPNDYSENLKVLFQFSQSKSGGLETTKRLEKLLIEKRKDDVLQVLTFLDDRIKDIQILSNLVYFDIGLDQLIPSNLMGDGILKFLQIIANIEFSKDGILIIDEIDNGLHFSVLPKLWQVIFNSARIFNCQVFLTTHNADVIKTLESFLEDEEKSVLQDDMRCFSVLKSQSDVVKVLKYKFENLQFVLEQNIEIR